MNPLKETSLENNYHLGIDIGGTKMSAVLMKGDQVFESYTVATPRDNLNHFLIMIKALTEPLFSKAEKTGASITRIGIGVAGTIDYSKNKITRSPNLPFLNDVKLIEKINNKLGVAIDYVLDNDANCFTRAEATLGSGKKFNNVYGMTIGTGIGGGWSLNGQIYKGSHGGTGEPGAMLVDLENKITLEAAYQKLTQNNPRLIALEAYEGDPLAEQVFQELGEYLGMIFANIVNIIDPGIIIIGGGTASSSDLFLSTARQTMLKYIANPEANKIKIIKSKLGNLAGAIGAALI